MTCLTATRPVFKASIVALVITAAGVANATDLTIEIKNIETNEGNMNVAVYDNGTALKERSTYRAMRQPAQKGRMELVFRDMPAGEYGVMLFQDINGNDELDTNLLGIPSEPWSASLLGRSVFGAPGWEDINFKLPDTGDRITIDMQ